MATKAQIDALKVGDKVEVLIPAIGKWAEVTLAPRNDADGMTHLEVLIHQWGYDNMRIPG